MLINTEKFGEVDVDEEMIFEFVKPVIGFEQNTKYFLISHNEQSPFKWLQSAESPELAFPVTYASYFDIEYSFELSDEDVAILGLENLDDLLVLNIANIPHNLPQNATINLLSPLVFNIKNKKAMQTILTNSNLPTRYSLFSEKQQTVEKV